MTLTLRRGPLELLLGPEQGGSVLHLCRDGLDLLLPTEPGSGPRSRTCFPLVPFSGRVDHGRFTFRGQEFRLQPNYPPEPHAIHGDAWVRPWRVEASDETTATISFEHAEPDAPFRYRAEQRFALDPDGLEITLSVTHQGDAPMPYGLGFHPYFPRRPGTLLSAHVEEVWMPDDTKIPRSVGPVPAAWGFADRRPVDELDIDHSFRGWDGAARIDWPDSGVSLLIGADPLYGHLVVYVPPGRDFFCVEPVSHAADGFNLMERGVEGTGVRVLEPGASLGGAISFRVSDLRG